MGIGCRGLVLGGYANVRVLGKAILIYVSLDWVCWFHSHFLFLSAGALSPTTACVKVKNERGLKVHTRGWRRVSESADTDERVTEGGGVKAQISHKLNEKESRPSKLSVLCGPLAILHRGSLQAPLMHYCTQHLLMLWWVIVVYKEAVSATGLLVNQWLARAHGRKVLHQGLKQTVIFHSVVKIRTSIKQSVTAYVSNCKIAGWLEGYKRKATFHLEAWWNEHIMLLQTRSDFTFLACILPVNSAINVWQQFMWDTTLIIHDFFFSIGLW